MSRLLSSLFILVFGSHVLCSQGTNSPSIKQHSVKSPCSSIIALAGNIDLKCSSLTPAQQKLLESLPGLLKKILHSQPDAAALSTKMDQVLEELGRPVQVVSAQNGIAIGGNNSGNPTVNNYGPPLAKMTFFEKNLTSPATIGGIKEIELHIRTDRSIPGAIIGITMSGPVNDSKEYFEAHNPSVVGAGSWQVNRGGPLIRGGMSLPYSFSLTVAIPSAFVPGEDLVVPIQALGDYHILTVEQLTQ